MKKLQMLAGVLTLGLVAGGTMAVNAASTPVGNDKVSYTCWSGKTLLLDRKTFEKGVEAHHMPGSAEHKLGQQKMQELRAIPGVVTVDGQGHETITIDDNSPAIQSVMKKYEQKERPACQ